MNGLKSDKPQAESLVLDPLKGHRFSHLNTWIILLLAVGILARTVRYMLQFPLWEDETFLCINFARRSFAGLLEPLDNHQIASVLFLWLEKAATVLLGFNELSLRLFPFLFSILGLFIFVRLARRLAGGSGYLMAVAFFAVSYPTVRYAAEAKQFGSDMFSSLVLIWLFVEGICRTDNKYWRWMLFCVPLALGLSYPALFTAAGLSLTWLVWMLKYKQNRWMQWMIYNVVLAGSAAAVYFLVIRNQMSADLGFQTRAYDIAFPPLDSVVGFIKWFFLAHVGPLFAYPAGGQNGGSAATTILCIIGMIYFIRQKRGELILLLAAPMAIHFFAAVLRKYPYTTHVKFSMYISTMICLFAGVGLAVLLTYKSEKKTTRDALTGLRIAAAALSLVAISSIFRDIITPYKNISDLQARGFAQWFWSSGNFHDRTVDLHEDLGISFSKQMLGDLSWNEMYLCNKYIYGSVKYPEYNGPLPDKSLESPKLRCVVYRDMRYDFDCAACGLWLESMQKEFQLQSREIYPFIRLDKHRKRIVTVDYAEIFTFSPCPESPDVDSWLRKHKKSGNQ